MNDPPLSRRSLLRGAAGLGVASAFGLGAWRGLAGAAPTPSDGPYGPLGPPDALGIRLPGGFSSRLIGRRGEAVANTGYPWHRAPDGGACFATPDGGWVYVSNSEVRSPGAGGVSAVRFGPDGAIVDAYAILHGTIANCAGGPMSWGTWLSCEENGATGQVYECDPFQPSQGILRAALGSFAHEGAAEDQQTGMIYLTEDAPDGRLYRFVPSTPGDLTTGTLQAAKVAGQHVSWVDVSPAGPERSAATTAFNGGEGIDIDRRTLYFTTKGDRRVWRISLDDNIIEVVYDAIAGPPSALTAVDTSIVHRPSGDLFVAEDGGNMELVMFSFGPDGPEISPFLRFTGHASSEVTGPAFTPRGDRLYVSSQRGVNGADIGVTVEIVGPFRRTRWAEAATTPPHGRARRLDNAGS